MWDMNQANDTVRALASLKEALDSTKELLRLGSEGSKNAINNVSMDIFRFNHTLLMPSIRLDDVRIAAVISYLHLVLSKFLPLFSIDHHDFAEDWENALEKEQNLNQFHRMTARLEKALNEISHEDLDISDEVKEKGLDEKLEVMDIADRTQESLALHEMVSASNGDPWEKFEKMSLLLKKSVAPGIVHELKSGSMEARENAAATLFSLSVVDEYKTTALFNLCFYRWDKLLIESIIEMMALKDVPVLVDFIATGFPRNRENAAAVLVNLCAGDKRHLVEAKKPGVTSLLIDLA
ncbi:U-box domain-containing protein 13, partial [Cucurbita argyrosperma subsp. argyrosperma]